jgi:hypothetical protein
VSTAILTESNQSDEAPGTSSGSRFAIVTLYPEDLDLIRARADFTHHHDEMLRDCTYVDDCAWFPAPEASNGFVEIVRPRFAEAPFTEIEPIDIWADEHQLRTGEIVLMHVTRRDVWWSIDASLDSPGVTSAMVSISALDATG